MKESRRFMSFVLCVLLVFGSLINPVHAEETNPSPTPTRNTETVPETEQSPDTSQTAAPTASMEPAPAGSDEPVPETTAAAKPDDNPSAAPESVTPSPETTADIASSSPESTISAEPEYVEIAASSKIIDAMGYTSYSDPRFDFQVYKNLSGDTLLFHGCIKGKEADTTGWYSYNEKTQQWEFYASDDLMQNLADQYYAETGNSDEISALTYTEPADCTKLPVDARYLQTASRAMLTKINAF